LPLTTTVTGYYKSLLINPGYKFCNQRHCRSTNIVKLTLSCMSHGLVKTRKIHNRFRKIQKLVLHLKPLLRAIGQVKFNFWYTLM